jgi:hypothetical protein
MMQFRVHPIQQPDFIRNFQQQQAALNSDEQRFDHFLFIDGAGKYLKN